MAAQVVKRLPEGDDWIYELKFDGYRALMMTVPSSICRTRSHPAGAAA
jgi:ATP-dependent DNA ligase